MNSFVKVIVYISHYFNPNHASISVIMCVSLYEGFHEREREREMIMWPNFRADMFHALHTCRRWEKMGERPVKMMFLMSIVLCPVVFGAVLPRSTNRIVKTCYSPCINITVHASEVRDVFVTSCRLNSVFVIGNMSSVRIHPLDQKNGQCGKSYIFQFQLSYLAHIPYNEPHPYPPFFWTSSTEVIKFTSICFFMLV